MSQVNPDNLAIYNQARAVPKEAQKSFNNGRFAGTDINPMWRIKKLTELFGPCGFGWYVDDVVERAEEHGGVTMAIVNLKLYVKIDDTWSQPIYGTGGNILLRKDNASDEGYKMAYTDALSVACKALGIGADVYWDKDKTKYDNAPTEQKSESSAPAKKSAPAEKKMTTAAAFKFVPDGFTETLDELLSKDGPKGLKGIYDAGNEKCKEAITIVLKEWQKRRAAEAEAKTK